MALYLLFESASGFSLFHAHGIDEIGQNTEAVCNSVLDLTRFGKVVKLAAFRPFSSALDALNQCNAASEGLLIDELRNFLELNLPKIKEGKKPKFSLGVVEPKIGSQISESTKIPCQSNEFVLEILRGVRLHFERFIKDLKQADLEKAQLGLGHSYSRAKVKFNVNRVDNVVIQAIFLLDALDKDINSFSMRVGLREQVEERLDFYDKGVAPRKNLDVMKAAIDSALNKDSQEKQDGEKTQMDTNHEPTQVSVKKCKKKRAKSEGGDGVPMVEDKLAETVDGDALDERETEKKKKKKEKRKSVDEPVPKISNGTNGLDYEQNGTAKKKKKNKGEEGDGNELHTPSEVKKKKKCSKSKDE